MNTILKQSAVRGTDSEDKRFRSAVLRLTAYYAMGAFFILAVFSILVYVLFVRALPEPDMHDEYVETLASATSEPVPHELAEHLMEVLLLTDAALFALVLALGFILSRATLAPLQASYVRQKRFIADVTHELRTPLSVLRSGSDYLLARERSSEEYRSFVEIVRNESRHLSDMTDDLLLLARTDEQKARPFAKVDLSAIVTRECAHLRLYAAENDVSVVSDAVASDCVVDGDESQLTRLLKNLLRNAIDYNTIAGTVEVTLGRVNGTIELVVRDTGIGIPPEALESIFERFYKVDHARTSGQSGTGLGLAIVQNIVRTHGGSIRVKSTVDVGTTVTVVLPVAQ